MSTVFNSEVHKRQYDEGVMEEMRSSIPMASLSKVRTDNVEVIVNRYGDDSSAFNTTDGNYAVQTDTYTVDSKVIDKEAVRANNIRYKDMAREGFDIAVDLADRHGFALAEAIHRNAAIVGYQLANGVLDNEVLNGNASALTPIAISTSNPDDIAGVLTQVLMEREAFGQGTPFMMMSPKAGARFNIYSMGAGFQSADNSLRNGLFKTLQGGLFGLDLIVTNEVPRSINMTFAGQPTAAETFSVAGVTFTIVASIGATAGNILIGGSAAATITNIVAAINAASGQGSTAGSGVTFVLPTAANQTILRNAGVIASGTATVLTIVSTRFIAITEGMTNVTLGTYTENILCGLRNAVEIVTPSNGYNSDEKAIATVTGGFNGVQVTNTQVHDAHVFFKNRDRLVRMLATA